MKRNLAAEANVARSLIRAGLLFNAVGGTQADGEPITFFQVPFGSQTPFDVYGYISGNVFVAQSAVETAIEESRRLAIYEAVSNVPFARLVRDAESSQLLWVEACTALASDDWSLADPVAQPVHAVAAAVGVLHKLFSDSIVSATTPQMRVVGGERFATRLDLVVAPR